MSPLRVQRLELWLHYDVPERELAIDYTPVTSDASEERELRDYHAQFRVRDEHISDALRRKLVRLAEYVQTQLAMPEIEIDGAPVRGHPILQYYQVVPEVRLKLFGIQKLHAVYYATRPDDLPTGKDIEDIPDGIKRLIENIFPTCEQLAWSHLRERFGHPASPASNRKRKVFVSYRKGNTERQRFAEAIAHRLGREGFQPWFDDWEIKAGDSIARELGAGFEDVYGIIVVLSGDYPGGHWAREEMETAITKRTEENIRIIPTLYEDCERPELLRALRYVDCRDHSEGNFERQFSDIIDALNEIELNPYR